MESSGPLALHNPLLLTIVLTNARDNPYIASLNDNATAHGSPESLPARSKPGNQTNAHDNAHSRRGVIHVLAVDGIVAREVERDGAERQVEEADGVEWDGEAAEAVDAADFADGLAGEEGEEAGEEGEGV